MDSHKIALITGGSGFAGSHLARLVSDQVDVDLWTCDRSPAQAGSPTLATGRHMTVDLLDEPQVEHLIRAVRPTHIYHLAGQAFVGASWAEPWKTLEANVRAQLNLMEAVRAAGLSTRFLVVGSMEVYGRVPPHRLPVSEDYGLQPDNPYGTSKATQEMLARQYGRAYGLPVVCVRPFNHIGPGQSTNFVAPAFAAQIAAIEAGLQPPVMKVGNLTARRDFTDVRDMVRAYAAVLEAGEPDEVYNIGSGRSFSMQYLLDTLLAMSSISISVEADPSRFRHMDSPDIMADTRRLHERTGWQPEIPLDQTLRDVLADARLRVRQARA